ncbi:hypothetical protein [Halohasta litorea]|uniref:Domain of unknown function domain-containing protein n=1 Tax=Halohasta litorea TaxID=869891 RepID=A0ABD6D656_9EURY|nr:hypothetical protein [Halohasta litorea]
MTSDSDKELHHPAGLISDNESECLFDGETSQKARDELREQISNRLGQTLRDFAVVYPTLRECDIESVFDPDSPRKVTEVRAATQDALAMFVYGMLTNGDMLEMRLQDAIQNAAISYGEQIDVKLSLRRGPLPTIEQFIVQADEEGISEGTLTLLEYFLYETDVSQEKLIEAAECLSIDFSEEDIVSANEMGPCVRKPQIAFTDVTITDEEIEDSTENNKW